MINRFIQTLLRHRWITLTTITLSLLVSGYFVTRINVDNDTRAAIPKDLKPLRDYEKIRKDFPSPYNILFLAEFRSGTLQEKIDSLRSWSRQFGELPGIISVTDLTSLQVPAKKGFLGLSSSPIVPPGDTVDETKVRDMVRQNSEFCGLFLSEDETRLGMIITFSWESDRELIIKSMLDKTDGINSGDHINAYLTSEGAISYFIDKAMKRNFGLLLPICFLLIFFLLYRVFRNMLHVFASLFAVAAALVWTFGLMGLLHVPFSITASIIPIIIFPIGVADAIHLIRTYSNQRKNGNSSSAALVITYRELLIPCLLTSLTTFAGFASFGLSKITWNRTFGIFTGIAVLFCYVFNVVVLPLFLSFEKRSPKSLADSTEERVVSRFWDFFINATLETKKWMVLLPVFIILLVIGFKNARVENNFMMMLPSHNQLRKSDDFIARHFGGTRFFSIVLEKKEGTITTEEQWRQIDSITAYLDDMQGIGSVTSLMPLVKKVSMMLTKKPLSSAAISLITGSDGFFGKAFGKYIANFLSADRKRVRIQVAARNEESADVLGMVRQIDTYVADRMPGYTATISGPAVLAEGMSAVLVNTLITSLIATCIPVFLCLVFFFRSLRIGIYCITPIMLLIAFVYALMGVFNVSINLITVVIMNTCVGIGIDYAIHFISGYRLAHLRMENSFEALVTAIREKGTPILFNTLVVGIGFCVLFFASFPPIRDFGFLVFISMFVAAGFCIFIISILITTFGLSRPAPRKETA